MCDLPTHDYLLASYGAIADDPRMSKKSTRGGVRAGAGRKRLAVARVPVHVMVAPEIKDLFVRKATASGQSQAKFFASLIA